MVPRQDGEERGLAPQVIAGLRLNKRNLTQSPVIDHPDRLFPEADQVLECLLTGFNDRRRRMGATCQEQGQNQAMGFDHWNYMDAPPGEV